MTIVVSGTALAADGTIPAEVAEVQETADPVVAAAAAEGGIKIQRYVAN
jgi:hypothetical protein